MGRMKEIDTKWKELKRSISRSKGFKISFKNEEVTVLARDTRHRGQRTEESDQDLVHSSEEY